MSTLIDNFISAIAKPKLANMFNPWSDTCKTELNKNGWKERQNRLRKHLNCPSPTLLILGEAPGYQGCRFSGIPFTSEGLLLDGSIPRISDLQGQRITSRSKPWREQSSTIIWKALYEYGLAENTVMFNAVPWHPEGVKGPLSNRTPTPSEKKAGLEYLTMLLDIFNGLPIVALGNIASDNLNAIGIVHTKIRHPANGGALKFREGLAAFSE